jgi:hypothetical protein
MSVTRNVLCSTFLPHPYDLIVYEFRRHGLVLSTDCGVKLLSYLHGLPIVHAEVEVVLATAKTTSPLLIPSLATLISGNLVSCWSGLYTEVGNIKETLLDPPPHPTRDR